MAFKFVAILAFVAAASAGLIPAHYQHEQHSAEQLHHHQPAAIYHHAPAQVAHVAAPQHQHQLVQHHQNPHTVHEEYPNDPHPQYKFAYDVQDSISGDSKSHTESRDGDVVHGEYSLNDADGFRRTVKYTSDPHNGFNAVVHREPLAHHKIVPAAPAAHYHHAQPTYTAPAAVLKVPSYATLPAHHEEHSNSYTTYEVPQQHTDVHAHAQDHEQYYHHH